MSVLSTSANYYRSGHSPLGPCVGYEAGISAASVARFKFRTGIEGASSLSFLTEECTLKYSSGGDFEGGTHSSIRFAVTEDADIYKSYAGPAGSPCRRTTGLTGSITQDLYPNTDYYLWLFPNFYSYAVWKVGTCTVTLEGSYARQSSATASDGVFGQPLSITLSRNADAVRHSVKVSCLGREELIAENSAAYPIVTWESSIPDYAPLMPDAPSAPAEIAVTSYLGEKELGTHTFTVTMSLPESMKPRAEEGWLSLSPLNEGAAEGFQSYISGYSRVKAEFDETKIDLSHLYGASLSHFSLKLGGSAASSAPYESGIVYSDCVATASVVDSRGLSYSESFPISPAPYHPPRLSLISVYRSDESGTEDENGNCYSARATLDISEINGENSALMHCFYRLVGGDYGIGESMDSGITKTCGPVSPDLSCEIKIEATDALGNSVNALRRLPTRTWAMKFRPDGSGVAFGKAAEQDKALEIHGDWTLRRGDTDLALFMKGVFEMTVPASLWDNSKATVPLPSLRAAHTVFLDLAPESAGNIGELTGEYAKIYRAQVNDGGLTLHALSPPVTDIPLRLVVLSA